MICPQCNTHVVQDSGFCPNCGITLKLKNKKNTNIVLIILGIIIGSCLLCGLFGTVMNLINPKPSPEKELAQLEANVKKLQEKNKPPPPSPKEILEKIKTIYSAKDIDKDQLKEGVTLTETLPKDSAEYKEAKKLFESAAIRAVANEKIQAEKDKKEDEIRKKAAESEEKQAKKKNERVSETPPRETETDNPTKSRKAAGKYIRGPRGGCYYLSGSGRKVYVDRSVCN